MGKVHQSARLALNFLMKRKLFAVVQGEAFYNPFRRRPLLFKDLLGDHRRLLRLHITHQRETCFSFDQRHQMACPWGAIDQITYPMPNR